MKKFQKIVTIISLLLFLRAASLASSPFTALTDSVKKYYLTGDLEKAEKTADSILKKESNNPIARLVKGLLLIPDGGLEDRLKARDLIETYSKKLKHDAFAYYALGLVYKAAEFNRMARNNFRKAVQADSTFVEAYIQLAKGHFRDMLQYKNKFSDTSVPLSLREFAIDDFDAAVYYLKLALKYSPGNASATYLLGNLYYEMEEYRQMEKLFQQALTDEPDDKNLNLFLGLSCLAQHDYPQASRCFRNAMKKMSLQEREEFLDPKFLIKKQDGTFESLQQKQKYWETRDPMFLTEENERQLEHFGRLAYANLRFSVPKLHIEGWQTDRGKSYIRYGKPDYIVDYGKSMEWNAIFPPTEIWAYPDFQLMFSDEFWNGHYQYTQPFPGSKSAFKERTSIDYGLVAHDVFQEHPEKFNLELAGGKFFVPFRMLFFKGNNQETETLLSFGLPLNADEPESASDYLAGIFLLGKDSLPVFQRKEPFRVLNRENQPTVNGNYELRNLSFSHESGSYGYSFELLNETRKKNFVYRSQLKIPQFIGNSLQLSDLLLASEISPTQEKNSFSRNGFYILPNLSQEYFPTEKVLLYFEVYNLAPDALNEVPFRVESLIVNQDQGNILKKIFRKKKQSISIVNEYLGDSEKEIVVQSLDVSNLIPGNYRLEITVQTEKSGLEARQNTSFVIKKLVTD